MQNLYVYKIYTRIVYSFLLFRCTLVSSNNNLIHNDSHRFKNVICEYFFSALILLEFCAFSFSFPPDIFQRNGQANTFHSFALLLSFRTSQPSICFNFSIYYFKRTKYDLYLLQMLLLLLFISVCLAANGKWQTAVAVTILLKP